MRLQQLGASRVLQNEIDVFEPVHCSVLNFMLILPCIFIAQLEGGPCLVSVIHYHQSRIVLK